MTDPHVEQAREALEEAHKSVQDAVESTEHAQEELAAAGELGSGPTDDTAEPEAHDADVGADEPAFESPAESVDMGGAGGGYPGGGSTRD